MAGKKDEQQDVAVATTKRQQGATYLFHDGKFTTTVPPVTVDFVNPETGDIEKKEIRAAETVSGDLPKDSRFGRYKIGVAHAVTNPDEIKSLRERGFRDATAEEIESSTVNVSARVDKIAAQERARAARSFARTPNTGRTN